MFKQNIKAVLNTQRRDKNGNYPLRIRTTIQRKVSYYSTGIMLKPGQLTDGEIIKHPNKALLNTALRTQINEIEKELLEQSITGEDVIKVKKNVNLKFTDYATKKINAWERSQGKATIKHKRSYLNKINEFNPSIRLKDFDKETLAKLEDYCRGIGNIGNTVWSCSKFVKTIINAAVEDGTLSKSPIKGFKGQKYADPFRDVLTAAEIELFEQFAANPLNSEKLLNVANWFLFSCYTGLRHGDLANFKGFVNGKVFLQTEKTKEVVSIFATSKIIEIKERLTRDVFTNQRMNDYLKIIAAGLGIEKKVTYHLGRHSFSVNFLERGGDLFILSKILGHTSIKTTESATKISLDLERMMKQEAKRLQGES